MSIEKFKPKNKSNDIRFTLRIPEELHESLATYATKQNISMNKLILDCIEYAMTNKED